MKKLLIAALLLTPFYSVSSGSTLSWDLGYSNTNGSVNFDHVTNADPALNNGISGDYNYVNFVSDKNANSSDQVFMQLQGWSDAGDTVGQETMQFWSNGSTYKGGIIHDGEVTTSPEHAADNIDNRDYFLLSFTDANGNAQDIDLKGVRIKYEYKDGETGNGPFDATDGFQAIALNSMPSTTSGWDFTHDHVVDLTETSNNNYYSLDDRSFSSNLWLIGFNSLGNDAFKFVGVKGLAVNSTTNVSEPGALGLFALGLAFLARRKRT